MPATNLLRRVGLEANFNFLRDLGLHDLETPAESFGISMAIGALPTRLEDVMRAYAALADDGIMRELAFTRDDARRPARRVLSVDSARLIASMLVRPAGAASLFSALRAARISVRRRREDRHVASLSGRLDDRLFA